MIAAQEARRGVVRVASGSLFEHAMGDEQPQDPSERVRVDARLFRNLARVCRLLADRVGDSERGRHVQAARGDVRPRKLADETRRGRRAHY